MQQPIHCRAFDFFLDMEVSCMRCLASQRALCVRSALLVDLVVFFSPSCLWYRFLYFASLAFGRFFVCKSWVNRFEHDDPRSFFFDCSLFAFWPDLFWWGPLTSPIPSSFHSLLSFLGFHYLSCTCTSGFPSFITLFLPRSAFMASSFLDNIPSSLVVSKAMIQISFWLFVLSVDREQRNPSSSRGTSSQKKALSLFHKPWSCIDTKQHASV